MLVSFENRPVVLPLIDEMISLDSEIGELFAPSFLPLAFRQDAFAPRMDVAEGKNDVVVTVELPGVSKEDVNISLEKDLLTISGERKGSAHAGDAKRITSERPSGKFSRTVRLPYEIEASVVGAVMADGLLTVTLPKAESAKPREIAVK